jgi:hypothetical protein
MIDGLNVRILDSSRRKNIKPVKPKDATQAPTERLDHLTHVLCQSRRAISTNAFRFVGQIVPAHVNRHTPIVLGEFTQLMTPRIPEFRKAVQEQHQRFVTRTGVHVVQFKCLREKLKFSKILIYRQLDIIMIPFFVGQNGRRRVYDTFKHDLQKTSFVKIKNNQKRERTFVPLVSISYAKRKIDIVV